MQKTLTSEDRKKLKLKIWRTFGFVLFAIAIFSAIYFFVLRDSFQHTDDFKLIPMIIFGIFGIFFLGVLGYMVLTFVKDLNAGVKDCFEGIIEDKKLNIKQSTSRRGGYGSRGSKTSKTSTSRYYYMIVDGKEHKIEYTMYMNIKVGDTIYFEVAPTSHTVLFYEILENATPITTEPIVRFDPVDVPNSKIRQAPLTRKNKDVIRVFYDKKLRRRIALFVIVGLPIFGLVYNGLPFLALYIFPLPIIAAYQLYKLITLFFNFKKSINEGRKNLVATLVTDKVFTTISNSKGNHVKYTVKTAYKTVLVSEYVYPLIIVGDEITLHIATHLPIILGVTIEDEYYEF
ncbi:hypothetical protein [uncultured Kordia sp.]|uniref:hypothetical protein n=1 Tax=uncultured Kordia sp. TaxID=507699 RepID=UPI002615CEBD|nr:hypothetical protein [uncultured Kordia sp.]